MDVKIKSEDCNFKMRVAGCVVKDGKILGVQMCNNGFYCLPGGHAELGESSKDAAVREMKEELELDCKVINLICLLENFFNGKERKVHEVCYIYLMEPVEDIETKDYTRVENDKGVLKNLEFKWIDLNDIGELDFRPNIIKDKLKNKDWTFEHIIYKEN